MKLKETEKIKKKRKNYIGMCVIRISEEKMLKLV